MNEPRVILVADDYGQAPGIGAGIRALAAAGRLSATSAMTNMAHWPGQAALVAPLRGRLAVGLHLNLTHGAPLGAMPRLAPEGRLPALGRLMTLSLSGRLAQAEIEAEIARQLDAFEAAAGAPPDHVDGHQHVHVLPGVRGPLLAALARRYPGRRILVRDPRDRPGAMARRGSAAKAAFVAALATGLSAAARRAGCVTNRGFSGFSDFGATPYAAEFPRFLQALGPVPMVMCHPGEGRDPDDPIAARRPEELSVLMADPALPGRIWLPARVTPDAPVDWPVHD